MHVDETPHVLDTDCVGTVAAIVTQADMASDFREGSSQTLQEQCFILRFKNTSKLAVQRGFRLAALNLWFTTHLGVA